MQSTIDFYFKESSYENCKSAASILIDVAGSFSESRIFKAKSKKAKESINKNVLQEIYYMINEELEIKNYYVPGFNDGPSQGGQLEDEYRKNNIKYKEKEIRRCIFNAVVTSPSNRKSSDFVSFKGFNLEMEFSNLSGKGQNTLYEQQYKLRYIQYILIFINLIF
jgi:hypothetical protein